MKGGYLLAKSSRACGLRDWRIDLYVKLQGSVGKQLDLSKGGNKEWQEITF